LTVAGILLSNVIQRIPPRFEGASEHTNLIATFKKARKFRETRRRIATAPDISPKGLGHLREARPKEIRMLRRILGKGGQIDPLLVSRCSRRNSNCPEPSTAPRSQRAEVADKPKRAQDQVPEVCGKPDVQGVGALLFKIDGPLVLVSWVKKGRVQEIPASDDVTH